MNLVNSILTLVSFVGMIFFLLAPLLVEDCYVFLIYPLIIMTTLLTWSLIHEGIHYNLFKRVRLNNLGARILSIAFGTAFYGVSEAHLAHHKFNRSELERPDILDEAEGPFLKNLSFFFHILGGIYFKEFIIPFVFFLPIKILSQINNSLLKSKSIESEIVTSFLKRGRLFEARFDTIMYLTTYLFSFYLYTDNGVEYIFFTGLLLRALILSLSDYCYHYQTSVNDVLYAKNLQTKLAPLMLYFNLHGEHHKNASKSWIELRDDARVVVYDGKYFNHILMQFRGVQPLEFPVEKS